MSLNLPMRNVDKILKCRAAITLTSGETIIGYGDCMIYLPLNDNTEEEDEFLLFVDDDGNGRYLLDADIKEYDILS